MKSNELDETIAEYYLEKITEPIKFGENGVFFWFPGSGMTTILGDIFKSKKLLKKSLQKLALNVCIVQFEGHLSDKKNLNGLLNGASHNEIKESCLSQLKEGNEVIYVITRIDDYPNREKIAILKLFLKLNAINPRRVHIIFNSVDKPWFMSALSKYPEFITLANRMQIMPVLKGNLLEQYTKIRAKTYGSEVSKLKLKNITETYGGILQLNKEYLRSKGDTQTLELKLKVIWSALPSLYKEILKQKITGTLPKTNNPLISDLKELGVFDLLVFHKHKAVLDVNPDELLIKSLTKEELDLWSYLKKHPRQFISKDEVFLMLRPNVTSDISLWAIDKAISRFRKKLDKCGIDSSLFKTIKGKGYIWGG